MSLPPGSAAEPPQPVFSRSNPSSGTHPSSRFQILALDGGGVKAIFTAHVLARLEDDLGVRIVDHFDLIAGTSTGGIIALALGAGLRPAQVVARYEELATAVFPASRRRPWRLAGRLVRATYRQEPLRRALHDVFGDRRLGQSSIRLVVPSWDAQAGTVHVFKTPHHPRLVRDGRIPMVDVALATSAAPTFLPAAHVDRQRLIDGGVWANNPSPVAVAEAVSLLGVPLEAIRVLNIGTTDPLADHPASLDRAGLIAWSRRAVELTLTASGRGAQGLTAHLIGPTDYHRFDVTVPRGSFRLDNADPDALAGYAASASRRLGPIFTDSFGGHRAATYTAPSPLQEPLQ